MDNTIVATSNSISQTILDSINQIIGNLFSSVDTTMYDSLDNLVFTDISIIHDNFLSKLIGTSSTNGLILIANALLVGFTLYYCFRLIYSRFVSIEIETPYQFIFKLIIFGIAINSSYFICEKLIYLNSLISSSILEIGKNIFGQEVSFSSFISNINSIISIENENFNLFSFDGLLKSFISASLFNLLFSYALRYIMIKVFALLTPFSILTLINHSTSCFFRSWFKTLISLLIMQSFIAIILLIIFSLNFNLENIFSKLICIGSIYALVRANGYLQHLIGGISTDISTNISFMKNLIK